MNNLSDASYGQNRAIYPGATFSIASHSNTPASDGRAAPSSCEELGDEVDVATVRDLFQALHLVQGDVLPDEVAVGWVPAARGLSFSAAIQAIPPDFSRTSGDIRWACSTMKSFVSRLLA